MIDLEPVQGSRGDVGKVIDAEFGDKGSDRYCVRCDERYPRASTLCPRCGGGLVLWATHAATDQRRRQRTKLASAVGLLLSLVLLVVALLLR